VAQNNATQKVWIELNQLNSTSVLLTDTAHRLTCQLLAHMAAGELMPENIGIASAEQLLLPFRRAIRSEVMRWLDEEANYRYAERAADMAGLSIQEALQVVE
jgi:hypothetical protein